MLETYIEVVVGKVNRPTGGVGVIVTVASGREQQAAVVTQPAVSETSRAV